MADKIKLIAAALLVVLGVVGYYQLPGPPVVHVLSVLAGLGLGAVVAYLSVPGRAFFVFGQESWAEARKVVWPTRKETMQMTGVVIAFVVVMALFLWLVDGSLFWLLKLLMGRSD